MVLASAEEMTLVDALVQLADMVMVFPYLHFNCQHHPWTTKVEKLQVQQFGDQVHKCT